MAKYSDIKGFTVQTLSTDTVASQIAGGSWSAGGNLPGARDETTGGGTLTAGILFGGYDPPATAYKPETFEYNGTAWTEGGDMSNARSNFGGLGTQTAALAVGGQNPGLSPYPFNGSEEYNGSSWTTGGTLPGGFDGNYGCTGTQTAGLQIGGTKIPNTKQVKTLSYNGTAWSDTGHDVPTAVDRNGATGTSTAAMSGGGRAPSATNAFFTYNGSSWTAITNYPTSGYHFHLQGPYTDVIASGGYPLNTNSTWWDGSSWTAAPNMSNNHGQAAHANSTAGATSGDGFVAGADPSGFNGTEHWNSAPPVFTKQVEGQLFFNSATNTFKETVFDIPGATWASGGTKNNPSRNNAAFGTQTATVSAGESGGSTSNKTEEYNGTSWTEVNNLPTALASNSGAGVLTSGSSFGGSPTVAEQYIYDGTNWTDGADLNEGRHAAGAAGTSSSSAMMFGGHPPNLTSTEVYDGSSWSEKNDLNYGRQLLCGVGTVTAALAIGGSGSPPLTSPNQSELWDGVTWTAAGSLPVNVYGNAGSGTSTLSIAMGGLPPGTDTDANMRSTQLWNGASWSEIAEMANSRASAQGTGSAVAGFVIGGYNPADAPGYDNEANKTEEWTVDLANKTITTS